MAEIPTLELTTATLEELEERLERVKVDADRCGVCSESYCSTKVNKICGNDAPYCGSSLIRMIESIILIHKNTAEHYKKETSITGSCGKCSMIDKDFLKESGYHFCTHWHNLTGENGFCHAFSEIDEP